MYRLPTKSVAEAKIVTFDFTSELAESASLSGSPTVTKELLSGSDPGAAALTVGSPTMLSPLVQVLVSAGVANAAYKLACSCAASNGETHKIVAKLPVGDPD